MKSSPKNSWLFWSCFAPACRDFWCQVTEGMSGDPSILYIKTILDLFTAGIFATLLGYAVMTIAIRRS